MHKKYWWFPRINRHELLTFYVRREPFFPYKNQHTILHPCIWQTLHEHWLLLTSANFSWLIRHLASNHGMAELILIKAYYCIVIKTTILQLKLHKTDIIFPSAYNYVQCQGTASIIMIIETITITKIITKDQIQYNFKRDRPAQRANLTTCTTGHLKPPEQLKI